MRRLGVLLVITVTMLLVAAPAWAHVEISPDSAPKGSDAVLSFIVPNEMEDATTTKVQVQFPADNPIAEALVQPVPGWTAAVATKKVTTPIKTDAGEVNEAVNTVTWTATGSGIAAGDFQTFPVSVGLPDDADSLQFPTIQTYSNGQTVQWIQQTPPGGDEPEHPVPELTLTAGGESTATTAPAATPISLPKDVATTSDVDSAKNTAIVGVVVGAIGVILAAIALVMGRRKPTT